jgi:hypothetical protein
MRIVDFSECIKNLPVRSQSFITSRDYEKWIYVENILPWYRDLNDEIFEHEISVCISRQELISNLNIGVEKLLKIFYWGYPKGFQGMSNNLELIRSLSVIGEKIKELKQSNNLTTNDFFDFHEWTTNIRGLGISTYSKFLYFNEIKFNNKPSIILDSRLMNVFKNNVFEEYASLNIIRPYNAHKYFIKYIELTNQLAIDMDTSEENIEQFLFIFGNNLK